jgi:hypothetical protein
MPVGGRVKKLRAVEDPSAPIPEETTSELGESMYIECSFDMCMRIGSTGSAF